MSRRDRDSRRDRAERPTERNGRPLERSKNYCCLGAREVIAPHEWEAARKTYARRLNKGTGCWRQDSIQAALLGLTDDARKFVVTNVGNKAPHARFPGFLYDGFDWIPDVDQGGVIMIALQRMLMQCDGDRILLLPAWPKDWDVRFKLHAPRQTTVECVIRGGEVEMLKVAPESRRKDVEVMTSAAATVPATTRP